MDSKRDALENRKKIVAIETKVQYFETKTDALEAVVTSHGDRITDPERNVVSQSSDLTNPDGLPKSSSPFDQRPYVIKFTEWSKSCETVILANICEVKARLPHWKDIPDRNFYAKTALRADDCFCKLGEDVLKDNMFEMLKYWKDAAPISPTRYITIKAKLDAGPEEGKRYGAYKNAASVAQTIFGAAGKTTTFDIEKRHANAGMVTTSSSNFCGMQLKRTGNQQRYGQGIHTRRH